MKHKELLEKIQNALQEAPVESTHSYAQATALRVPALVPQQHPSSKPAARKTDIVTKEWNKEVEQTSNYSSQLEFEPSSTAHLIPDRVHRWNIKNYASIVRKMQMHIKAKKVDMTEKVSVITSDQQKIAKEGVKQDELWRDMMKVNEERQFRIGRITNYFS